MSAKTIPALIATFCSLAAAQAQEPTQPPDIVVFVLDDIGAVDVEQLGAASPSLVPAIDALAAQGTRFRRFHGQPQCAFARVSAMLSTWEGTVGGVAGGLACDEGDIGPTTDTLPHGLSSLPKTMEAAGYRTVLVGRWGLGTTPDAEAGEEDYAHAPGLWGFDEWLEGIPDGVGSCLPFPSFAGYSNWLRVHNGDVSISTVYNTVAIRDAFIGWWLATPGPRCAVVCLQAAHKGGRFDEWHIPPPAAMRPGYVLPPFPISPRQRYLAMVQSADYAVERMLEVVSLPDTFVVLCADNGTPQEVHPPGYTNGNVKFSTFEGGVRVPGVVAGLGFPAGQVSDQPVSVVDLLPTLAELAGIAVRHRDFDGQSILPALWGEHLERDWTYVRANQGHKAVVVRRLGLGGGKGPRVWKLRENTSGAQFVYDLDADPREANPRSPDEPGLEDVVVALRAALAEAQQTP